MAKGISGREVGRDGEGKRMGTGGNGGGKGGREKNRIKSEFMSLKLGRWGNS